MSRIDVYASNVSLGRFRSSFDGCHGCAVCSRAPAHCCTNRSSGTRGARAAAAVIIALLLSLFLSPSPAHAIISWDGVDPNSIQVINTLVGADRFYNAGYWGFGAVIANVEAGLVWNQQESFTNTNIAYVSDPNIGLQTSLYDFHATAVGFTLAGWGPQAPSGGYYYYQLGMAPGATLISAAIATAWDGNQGTFETSTESLTYAFKTVMQDGTLVPIPGWPGWATFRTADVVNCSWGYDDPAGNSQTTMIIDALAYANHQTVVKAAGNHDGSAPAQVIGPASGYNGISVAALGTALSSPPYSGPASFSNSGPIDYYNPQTGVTIPGVRCGVDIAAPGTDLLLATYTGADGTNPWGADPNAPGYDPNNLPTDEYLVGAAGTSFASPIVAGGAALVVDAGYDNFSNVTVDGRVVAVDGRVVKAVLLNSATKTAGWTNNMTLVNGVYTNTQAVDFTVGAGALNLNTAYDQYLSGSCNVTGLGGGTVSSLGWAYGRVSMGSPNDYFINRPLLAGEVFTATLCWFVNYSYDANAMIASPVAFHELDLQVWSVVDGNISTLIAQSCDPYDAVQEVYFGIPEDGNYAIQVFFAGVNWDMDGNTPLVDDYGLAWSSEMPDAGTVLPADYVPEPGCMVILISGFVWLIRMRRIR